MTRGSRRKGICTCAERGDTSTILRWCERDCRASECAMIPRNKHAIHPDDARSRDSPSVLKEARPFWKKTRNARATPISHHTPRHKYVLVGRWLLGRWLPPRLPPRLARGALRAARGPVSPDSSRGRSKPLPCLAPCSARLRLGKGCFARVASLRRCSLSTALPSLFPPPGTCSVRSLALSARIFSETGATTLGAALARSGTGGTVGDRSDASGTRRMDPTDPGRFGDGE